MINLRNDYSTICHKEILAELEKNISNPYVGYGMDEECEYAKDIIKKSIGRTDIDIHFITGGTVTNKILIGHALKPYEAVIAATTGHINTHETGAIEETGHKVLTVPSLDGKINPEDIKKVWLNHTNEHMVKPKMVYISNPTELGTVYKKSELKAIRKVCKELNLYLYLDGARLASAIASIENDMTLLDICRYTDAFYIGGTKNGLIFGEALVVINNGLKDEVRYSIKHFGGMVAKGFVMGIMFKTLFENDLFFRIGKHENDLALKLYQGLTDLGIKFAFSFASNQIFPILPNYLVDSIKDDISFEIWEEKEEFTTVRFVVNFDATIDSINSALNIIKERLKD